MVVRVVEENGYLGMDIARPEGKRERREYKARDLREPGAVAELTRQLLAQLYQEGYALASTYDDGRFGSTNTLVFTKRL